MRLKQMHSIPNALLAMPLTERLHSSLRRPRMRAPTQTSRPDAVVKHTEYIAINCVSCFKFKNINCKNYLPTAEANLSLDERETLGTGTGL